ncbi:MAG: archaetidylserine decarboxylase [Gammaproteobacteria bacterium]|nr:archaetidylserine decarboxylase [Gammaproteobacteria bacterium]
MQIIFVALQRILPHHLLSRIVGALANSRIRVVKNLLIRVFCRIFPVNVSEAVSSRYEDYPTFNAFFTRTLREGARTVRGKVTAPCDGTVSQAGPITEILEAKGHSYSLSSLTGILDTDGLANGSFLTIYLAPQDYHRVHMPIAGRLVASRYIPGKLFSVNPTTASRIADLFAVNERLVMEFETDSGPMTLVMVGAMIVAGIRTVWHDNVYPFRTLAEESFDPPVAFAQGDELGWFEMGSTVIVILPDQPHWQVNEGSKVRMGNSLA